MALPIWKRKHDLIYLIFFLTHIPIMFCKSLFFSARTANNRLAMHVEIDVSDMNARCRPYTIVSSSLEARIHDKSQSLVHHNLQRPILLFSTVSIHNCHDHIQSTNLQQCLV